MHYHAKNSIGSVYQSANPERETATDTDFFSFPIENPSILRLRFWVSRGKAFSFLSLFPGGAEWVACLTLLQADSPTFGGPESNAIELRFPNSYANFSIHRSFLGRCRRNCYRRHRSHFGKAAGYPAVISVNKVLFAEKPYNMDCNSSRKPIYWQYHIRGGHNSQTSVYRHRYITGNEMCIGR